MTPKIEFFNFGLEQKLDPQFCVEFYNDSDGDGFNFSKPELNPPKCPLGAPKNGIFQLWTKKQELNQHSCVEFHGDSYGNGIKAQRPIIDLPIGSH